MTMHQEVKSPSEAERRAEAVRKRKAFSYFYSGWNAFMEGRPKYPKGMWGIEALRWYTRGWIKAERAAENFKRSSA